MNFVITTQNVTHRKNQRALKLSTLVLLDTLVKNYPGSLDLATLSPVLAELPPLVSETDLHIAQLTLALLTSVTSSHASTIPVIQKSILPEVLKLAESPLLQGAALAAMLDFFRALVGAGVPGLSHSDMLALLVNPIPGFSSSQTPGSSVYCIVNVSCSSIH